ncbi:TetR/AcrR family transcriptional regulator [Verrucomicrobiota bacterium]
MTTREKIIKTAGKLFAQNGYDGTSIRAITSAANVNLGAVTYHFGSKLDLFGEIIQIKTAPLRALGKRVSESCKGPEEKIKEMMAGFAMHVLHDDPDLKVYFAEVLSGGNRLPPGVDDSIKWRNDLFREILEEGIRKDVFYKCDIENAPWCFFGMLSAYILYQPLMGKKGRRGAYSEAYVRKIADYIYDVFMDGIRVRKK